MNTQIQVFNHEQFGQIRTMTMPDGQVGFVGKDVAEVLGYSNPRDALRKHVDEDDKAVAFCDSLGGRQQTTFINESGLYALILSSRDLRCLKYDSSRGKILRYAQNDITYWAFVRNDKLSNDKMYLKSQISIRKMEKFILRLKRIRINKARQRGSKTFLVVE